MNTTNKNNIHTAKYKVCLDIDDSNISWITSTAKGEYIVMADWDRVVIYLFDEADYIMYILKSGNK